MEDHAAISGGTHRRQGSNGEVHHERLGNHHGRDPHRHDGGAVPRHCEGLAGEGKAGAGCSITAPSWSSDWEGISGRKESWRVDETYVRVKGRWCYLYRPSIPGEPPSISCCQRCATQMLPSACFARRSANRSHPQPRVINTDLAPIYSSAIPDIKEEWTLRNRCRHRPVQYLNNILEQDHRAIKRRVNAKQGFREF